ncbi:MAG: NUDIX hydrolase [Bacteroidales bacterium]
MIKIFYKKRVISLTDDKQIGESPDKQAVSIADISDIKVKINRFTDNSKLKHLNIYGSEPGRLLEFVRHAFIEIDAGGGLVDNYKGLFLFIYRQGKWDLPKGKAENNEAPELCALREVSEECDMDIEQLNLDDKLGITYHIYRLKDKLLLKKTYWYNMHYDGDCSKLRPQTEEDIEKCVWVDKETIPHLMKNSYASIEDLLKRAKFI